MDIQQEAYRRSIDLLRENSSSYGFLAARKSDTAAHKNYDAIFARDASMCAIAALATQDEELMLVGRRSLEFLAEMASSKGEIPFSVKPQAKRTHFRMPSSIDGNLWWLIAYWLYAEHLHDLSFKSLHYDIFKRAIAWLEYRMVDGLLEQGEGADWADEMPRSGLVLYSNALWLWFLQLIDSQHVSQIYKHFLFYFSSEKLGNAGYQEMTKQHPYYRKNLEKRVKEQPYFLSAVSRVTIDNDFDIFGNILTCLSGVVPQKRVKEIIKAIEKTKAAQPVPIRVMEKPRLRKQQGIFEETNQNKAWTYHNAGAWPMVGGWWVYLLSGYNKKQAEQELQVLAEVNSRKDWGFIEHFHGKAGKALGMQGQSWNAATYILAYKAVQENSFLI